MKPGTTVICRESKARVPLPVSAPISVVFPTARLARTAEHARFCTVPKPAALHRERLRHWRDNRGAPKKVGHAVAGEVKELSPAVQVPVSAQAYFVSKPALQ